MHCKKEELLSSIEDDCFAAVNHTPRCRKIFDIYDFMGPFTSDLTNTQIALETAIEEFNPEWACLIG